MIRLQRSLQRARCAHSGQCLRDGSGRHHLQAPQRAVPLRAFGQLGQEQMPRRARNWSSPATRRRRPCRTPSAPLSRRKRERRAALRRPGRYRLHPEDGARSVQAVAAAARRKAPDHVTGGRTAQGRRLGEAGARHRGRVRGDDSRRDLAAGFVQGHPRRQGRGRGRARGAGSDEKFGEGPGPGRRPRIRGRRARASNKNAEASERFA